MKKNATDTLAFERRISSALTRCGISAYDFSAAHIAVGAAVSGGADSSALLVALTHILADSGCALKVISINHNIRQPEETAGDAASVANLCNSLQRQGFNIKLSIKTFERGFVQATAGARKNGLEEAARFLRYKAFDEFMQNENAGCLSLAHNKNDRLETQLMRFLQGTQGDLPAVRQRYVRPMLGITRTEIEAYLTAQGIKWRTDSTNYDESYLRNRIRHALLPILDDKFAGWASAVLVGAKKYAEDEEALEVIAARYPWEQADDALRMDRKTFAACHPAIRRRLFFRAFSMLQTERRIPYSLIESAEKALAADAETFSRSAAGIVVSACRSYISVEKQKNLATELCFFVIIEKTGTYALPGGTVTVLSSGGTTELRFGDSADGLQLCGLHLPVCIRSRQQADEVRTADGKLRSVAGVFSDWRVPSRVRPLIPIVQDIADKSQEIVCIAGSVLGFPDWIVRRST